MFAHQLIRVYVFEMAPAYSKSDDLKFEAISKYKHATEFGRLRLRTLIFLRWLAVIGQTAALGIVTYVLKFELPLSLCLSAIAVSTWLNIALNFALPSQRILKQWEAATQLIFDILQLAFLLYLTGGMQNPFALLLIAPSTIAAATLKPRGILAVIIVTLSSIGFLHFNYLPLPWFENSPIELANLYRLGLSLGVGFGVVFTAGYAWRVASEESRLADALVATQTILAREQKLAALGSLAAAAAHELGSPLATIQLVSKELANDAKDGAVKDDANLIYSQSLRCRDILRNLTAHNEVSDPTTTITTIGGLISEAAARHDNQNKAIVFDVDEGLDANEFQVKRMPEILYGLGNFIENAVSYANSKVTINTNWDNKLVRIAIIDDGGGFDPDILGRLGEPYITSRGQGTTGAQKREGMGLGFFIAKTLLERSGAQVKFGNQTSPEHGAIVRVEWSRDDIEYKG